MPKLERYGFALALSLLYMIGSLSAQTTTPPPTSSPGTASSGTIPTRRGRGEPCWKQAGISPSVVQQHRSIVQNTRSQERSVCSDSALTAQEKQQKIHEIRGQAARETEALLTPQQAQTLRSCRQARGEGGHHGRGGLCGGMATAGRTRPTSTGTGGQSQPGSVPQQKSQTAAEPDDEP